MLDFGFTGVQSSRTCCSQNYGPLLVTDNFKAPNNKGYQRFGGYPHVVCLHCPWEAARKGWMGKNGYARHLMGRRRLLDCQVGLGFRAFGILHWSSDAEDS